MHANINSAMMLKVLGAGKVLLHIQIPSYLLHGDVTK